MTGTIRNINISRGGIPKFPVPEAEVHRLGIEGDVCANGRIHGGPLQAVLMIDLSWIEEFKELGYPIYPGALGENLTTDGMDRKQMRLGQRFRAGHEVVLEITKLRAPCNTLDVYGHGIQTVLGGNGFKDSDPQSPRWGLFGFYTSVTEVGRIREKDLVRLVDQAV